jgi:anthranilate synthase component 1
VIKTGEGHEIRGDPMKPLEAELAQYRYQSIPEVPTFTGKSNWNTFSCVLNWSLFLATGGAIGFVTYDCIQHFEPKTKRELRTPFEIPEAVFMFCDSILVFDHIYQTVKIVSHVYLPDGSDPSSLSTIYDQAVAKVQKLSQQLARPDTPLPHQPPIKRGNESVSNVGKAGYEGFVTKLKEHIVKGDIIQAVPSQRLSRPTSLHPFNAYRHLRQVNPSPYMFYLNCGDVQLVGASPETLCKVENRKVYNHAIAGTVKRGKTPAGKLPLVVLLRGAFEYKSWPAMASQSIKTTSD